MSYYPRTSADMNIAEARAAIPANDYEHIHAKIVRGINRQLEGDKEVSDGLREMIESKAYLKHYKTIAAYAEHEFGKSKSWIYERIKSSLPANEVNKQPLPLSDQHGNSENKKEQKALSQVEAARTEEPEKPRVKTRDEILAEQNGQTEAPKPKPRTENGVPKSQLGIWKKTEDSFGILIRAVDDVHRACPNSFRHDQVLHSLNGALSFFHEWRKSVK